MRYVVGVQFNTRRAARTARSHNWQIMRRAHHDHRNSLQEKRLSPSAFDEKQGCQTQHRSATIEALRQRGEGAKRRGLLAGPQCAIERCAQKRGRKRGCNDDCDDCSGATRSTTHELPEKGVAMHLIGQGGNKAQHCGKHGNTQCSAEAFQRV